MLYAYTRDEYFHAKAWTVDPKDPNVKIYNPFNFYHDPWNPGQLIVTQETYDRLKDWNVTTTNLIVYSTNVSFDGNVMDIQDTQRYAAQSEEFVFSSIVCDVGVAIEVGYELQSTNFSIMRNDEIVAAMYKKYLTYKEILDTSRNATNPNEAKVKEILTAQQSIGPAYQEFITVLAEALRMWEAEQKL
jgi:hypothetical protein